MKKAFGVAFIASIITILAVGFGFGQTKIYDRFGIIAEHGMHGAVPEENIDLFTGNLTLRFLDISIPGPHGLDINVWRVYNSKIVKDKQSGEAWGIQQEPFSWVGLGWSLHAGRIHNYNSDEPVFEFPDGRWETAYRYIDDWNNYYTRDFLKYDKTNKTLYFQNGTQWVFKSVAVPIEYLSGNEMVLVVEKIVNTYGQEITFEYYPNCSNLHYIRFPALSRTVTFNTTGAGTRMKLTNIQAPNGIYSYVINNYTQGVQYPRLDSYQPTPVLTPSTYEYYSGADSAYELTAVNTSYGGRMAYSYNNQEFYVYNQCVTSRVVTQKTLSGNSITNGVWNYTYPHYQYANEDTVTVSGPSSELNQHVTYHAYTSLNEPPWKIGLIKRRSFDDGSETVEYEWTSKKINDTHWFVKGVDLGPITAPLQSRITTTRAGDASSSEEYVYNTPATTKYGLPSAINHYGSGSLKYTTYLTYAFEGSNTAFEGSYKLSYVNIENNGGIKTVTTNYHNSNCAISSVTKSGAGGGERTWNYTDPGSSPIDYEVDVTLPGKAGRFDKNYYSYGILSQITHPTYTEFTRTIEQQTGRVRNETNQHGGQLSFTYDDIGRITKITMPSGFNEVNAIWYQNNVTITQGPYSMTKYWDGLGRDLGYTESGGSGVNLYYRKELDAAGRVVRETRGSPNANKKYVYTLDGLGRQKSIIDPLGKVTSIAYSGNQKTATNPRNSTWTYIYGALPGKVTRTTEPNSVQTLCQYDSIGRLISAVTDSARSHSFSYDCQDHVISETHPETGTISRNYNPENNLSTVLWGGATQTYTYTDSDQVNTLKIENEVPSLTEIITNAYDTRGRVSGVTSTKEWSRTGITYNALGSVLTETHTIPGLASSLSTNYGYDGNNILNFVTYPDGSVQSFTNGALNLPQSSMFNYTSIASSATYGYGGQLTGITLGNQAVFSSLFNGAGYCSSASLATPTPKGGMQTCYNAAYGYDAAGNVSSITGTIPQLDATSFSYDSLNRLTGAAYTTSETNVVKNFVYAYDNHGNMTRVTEDGTAVFDHAADIDSKNQITAAGYSWDSRGNLTARPQGRSSDQYTWDGANRLRQVREANGRDTENFLYDERGLRIKKWSEPTGCLPVQADYTIYTIYTPTGEALAEYSATGQCLKDYIYFNGTLLAEWQPVRAKLLYYTSDPVRSVHTVTDIEHKVVWSATFAPFGRMHKVWTNSYNPTMMYSGKERDERLGLDYFGARHYAYGLYRFISSDPVLNVDEAVANPQRWNRYTYCSNNPITRFDPDGGSDVLTSNPKVIAQCYRIAKMSNWYHTFGEWGFGVAIVGSAIKPGRVHYSLRQSKMTVDLIPGMVALFHTHPIYCQDNTCTEKGPRPSGIQDIPMAHHFNIKIYVVGPEIFVYDPHTKSESVVEPRGWEARGRVEYNKEQGPILFGRRYPSDPTTAPIKDKIE